MGLTDDMQRVVTEQRLGFVATVTADGKPNLSPKGTTTVLDDDHLLFVDLASPGTIRNLETNPHVEINVVDPLVRKGYRFKGTATVHTDGPEYDRALRVLRERGSTVDRLLARAIVIVEVTSAASLISPAYDLGADEAELSATWFQRYAALQAARAADGG